MSKHLLERPMCTSLCLSKRDHVIHAAWDGQKDWTSLVCDIATTHWLVLPWLLDPYEDGQAAPRAGPSPESKHAGISVAQIKS